MTAKCNCSSLERARVTRTTVLLESHLSCSSIRDLQLLVSPSDYQRIKNVPHIKSDDEFNNFDSYGLGIDKITNWWLHKKQHRWMIPSIVQSRSKISAEHWMITQASTNMNESQHKWTNSETGTGLSLAAAIVSAQLVDERVAGEIIDKLNTGVLRNSRNDLLNRMGRSVTTSHKVIMHEAEGGSGSSGQFRG
ncbi:hypothetical protein HGRIS_001440 [Hohenbuehelia grisea]|uniref:Uncharacterized protein n=1 Tax=Hohenbuehelia grisea TaxID=104357 RepID=A0ABR3JPB5_9AGAR